MLTENQIIQLEPLTKHPKFGALLKDTVEIWKRGDVTPIYHAYGIVQKDNYFFELDNKKGCCLLGGSLVDKKSQKNFISEVIGEIFNLSRVERTSLWVGFDDRRDEFMDGNFTLDEDTFAFGNQVRKIVNPIYYDKL